jgi:hypothetical protein
MNTQGIQIIRGIAVFVSPLVLFKSKNPRELIPNGAEPMDIEANRLRKVL